LIRIAGSDGYFCVDVETASLGKTIFEERHLSGRKLCIFYKVSAYQKHNSTGKAHDDYQKSRFLKFL